MAAISSAILETVSRREPNFEDVDDAGIKDSVDKEKRYCESKNLIEWRPFCRPSLKQKKAESIISR